MKHRILRKIIAVLLAAVLLLISVSCARTNGSDAENTGSGTQNSANSESAGTAAQNSADPDNTGSGTQNSANSGDVLPDSNTNNSSPGGIDGTSSGDPGSKNYAENANVPAAGTGDDEPVSPGSIIIEYEDFSYDPPVTRKAPDVLYRGVIRSDDETDGSISITGLKDTAVQDKINAAIAAEHARLSDPSYVPDVTGIRIMQNKFKDPQYVYSVVRGNVYNILSIGCSYYRSYYQYYLDSGQYRFRFQSVTEQHYLNFDLRTGEIITLGDVFIDGVDPVKFVNSRLIRAISDYTPEDGFSSGETFSMISAFKGIREDQPFYIDDNGDLVICIDSRNREFYLPYGNQLFTIDISKVSALESRFGQTEGLYEGDIEYYLRSYEPEGGFTSLSLDVYPQILKASDGIWSYSDVNLRQYPALSNAQNAFLGFDNLGLKELAAGINLAYDQNHPQEDDDYYFIVKADSSASCHGAYMNLTRSLTAYDSLNDGKYLSIYETRVYKQGSDVPLKASDLFVSGADWRELLKNAALKRLERENIYSIHVDLSDPGIELFYGHMIDTMDMTGGLSLYNDSLFIDFDEQTAREEASAYLKKKSTYDQVSVILEVIARIYYSDIGYENLVLFSAE